MNRKELEEFATLPWVRCKSCGKVTARYQEQFNQIFDKKIDTYNQAYPYFLNEYLNQGLSQTDAEAQAHTDAILEADYIFNQRVQDKLGIKRFCCFNTLLNPIVMPLGSGVELDPEVDIGKRLSKVIIKEKTEEEIKERWKSALRAI